MREYQDHLAPCGHSRNIVVYLVFWDVLLKDQWEARDGIHGTVGLGVCAGTGSVCLALPFGIELVSSKVESLPQENPLPSLLLSAVW